MYQINRSNQFLFSIFSFLFILSLRFFCTNLEKTLPKGKRYLEGSRSIVVGQSMNSIQINIDRLYPKKCLVSIHDSPMVIWGHCKKSIPKDWRFERCEMSHFYRKGKHIELIKSMKSIRQHKQVPRFFKSPCWWHTRSSTRHIITTAKLPGLPTRSVLSDAMIQEIRYDSGRWRFCFRIRAFIKRYGERERERYVILLFRIENPICWMSQKADKLDILTAGSRFMCFICDVFVLAWFFSEHWSNF